MSYILDALRKADAQRESDPARGIHAQPVRAAIGDPRPDDAYRAAFWVAAGAGVAMAAAAGWYLSRDGGAPPGAVASARVVAAAPAAQPAPVSQAAPEPAAPKTPPPAAAVLPPPVRVAPPPVAAKPARTAAKPAPKEPPAAASAAAPRAVAASRATPSQVATARSAAAAGSASAPASAVPARPATSANDSAPPAAGLPPDAPKLAISGGVYSANAAQRMLIVNGQVFNEGSEIGPAVILEQIKPKAAVVRFRGSRYTLTY